MGLAFRYVAFAFLYFLEAKFIQLLYHFNQFGHHTLHQFLFTLDLIFFSIFQIF